ncbi:hypothetical protein TUM17576_54980 [Enterobacter hormaechei]|nr:hypothetical protein [Enterobacter hormaechei]GJL38678.1 hypothetical protein TUM17576_54980 [Enterobacter hormaechei]
MKLKEILVQELPKHGGWPKGSEYACFKDFQIGFYMENGATLFPEWTRGIAVSACEGGVTKDQYEAAIAASTPIPGSLLQYGYLDDEWDGEGLPPVGCVVERSFNNHHFHECKIVAHSLSSQLPQAAFCDVDGGMNGWGTESAFRPIRSAADKKRDSVGEAIYRAINWNHEGDIERNSRFEDYCKAYDAIAAGKIPGVRIE